MTYEITEGQRGTRGRVTEGERGVPEGGVTEGERRVPEGGVTEGERGAHLRVGSQKEREGKVKVKETYTTAKFIFH